MNFSEAVKSVLIDNYSSFKGRAPRAEFWYFFLFTILLAIFFGGFFLLFVLSAGEGFDPEYVNELMNPDRCENELKQAECQQEAYRDLQIHFLEHTNAKDYFFFSLIVSCALFLPSFSVVVRRLQDLNRSFYFAAPYLIYAAFNLYVGYLFAVDPFKFLFETSEEPQMKLLTNISIITVIIYYLWFLQPGQYDENRFGPNKLEKQFDDTY